MKWFTEKMRTKCTALIAELPSKSLKKQIFQWSIDAETKSFQKFRSWWLGSSKRLDSTKRKNALQVIQATENT